MPLDFEVGRQRRERRLARERFLAGDDVAPDTARAYMSAIDRITRDVGPVISDAALAGYVVDLVDRGLSAAAVRLSIAAARWRARQADEGAEPVGPETRAVLRRVGRATAGRGYGQAPGLSWQEVDRVVDELAGVDATTRDLRDASLLAMMSDGLLRVGEAAAVDVADLEGEVLHIRRSKTDQVGRGAAVYLGERTRVLISRYLRVAGIEAGAAFRQVDRWLRLGGRISARSVRDVVRRRSREVLGRAGVRGHSLRVGSAQELVARGASLVELQLAGRWTSPNLPAHYGRAQLAGRGAVARLRYRV